MKDIKTRQYGRLTFNVHRVDDSALSATFIAQKEDKTISDTVNYDEDGIALFEFNSPDTDVIGEYSYQVNENFATGSPDIYPNDDECDGDCDLPKLEICLSLQEDS